MRTRELTYLLAMVFTLAACAGGSGSQGGSAANGKPGGNVVIRANADFDTLDPQGNILVGGQNVVMFTYDRLIELGPNAKPVPYLAKSWQMSADSITFTLRTDATCADGAPVTPTVVADSFKRMLDSKAPSTVAKKLFGPGPYTVTADDANAKVTITLGKPFSSMLYSFATPYAGIICPSGLANRTALATSTFGSGPYTIESATHNGSVKLKVRPDWHWGPGGASAKSAGFPSSVELRFVANDSTAANEITTGGIDIANIVGTDVARLTANSDIVHKTGSTFTTDSLVFNQAAGHPTTDLRVREALATAIDPKLWNQAANNGSGELSSSYVTPEAECYDAGTKKLAPVPSVEKARSLLLAAGYAMNSSGKLVKDGQPLTIRVIGYAGQNAGPEYLLNVYNQVGITTTLSKTDFLPWAVAWHAGTFDATVVILSSPYPVPDGSGNLAVLHGPFPPAGINWPRIDDPTMEAAINEAQSTTGSARCQAWGIWQQRMLTQHHILPLAAVSFQWFAKKGTSFYATAFQIIPSSIRTNNS